MLETPPDIIRSFELFMDDTTELSTDEEYDLLNTKFHMISDELPWELLKRPFSGTTDGTVNVSLPTRFSYITENHNYRDDSDYADFPVVFVGDNYEQYKLISFSDRRQYRTASGYAYVDLPNDNLVFTVAPASGKAVEFDYIEYPADLTSSSVTTDIWIPERFRMALVHLMASDDFVIQQSEKARSYQRENEQKAKSVIEQLKQGNARLIQM